MSSVDARSDAPFGQPAVSSVSQRPWYWWIVEYNPLYLLSAVSMLLGVLTLSNTTTWNPVGLDTLLPLLGALQTYELACLGVCVFLYRRFGERRDTLQLIGLVLLFAVDVSFLMSEIATQSVLVGSLTAGGLLVLSLAKFGAVAWLVRPMLTPAVAVTAAAGVVLLHVVPPALQVIDGDHGGVTVKTFYVLWWTIGLSPLLYQAAAWVWRDAKPWGEHNSKWWPRTLIAMPWVSLIIHTGVLHYVYDRPFLAPHAAPLLIGLALMTRPYAEAVFVRVALLAAAVFVSWSSPGRLAFDVSGYEIKTATAAIVAAWFALGYTTFPRYLHYMAGAAGVIAGWKLVGPTWSQATNGLERAWALAAGLLPSTRRGWGLAGIGGAFAMLAAGLIVSLRKHPPREEVATSPPDAPGPYTDSAAG